jgi:DNA excision repair protein ERCC-5
MGVKGLWDILLTIAQTIPIEKLSGKRIAIDASIWIVKINSIFNEDKDRLKSIISKIAMMKRYNILPVFVFDGQPPILKRKTLEERRCKKIIAGDL